MTATGATSYRGETLDEVLPRIREELGPDAVIVRQREGIVGGVGGFFGKRCVEVEARPADVRPSAPARAVVDAYDTGDERGPEPLFDALMAQTAPFVEHLSEALAREPEAFVREAVAPVPEPDTGVVPAPQRLADLAVRRVRKPAGLGDAFLADEEPAVRAALAAAGIPASLEDEIMAEVEQALRPFEPLASYRELARRALARRLKVTHGWRSRRRTIAIVGLPGSGRTLASAKLCQAYARAGRSVGALSIEPAKHSLRLGELAERAGVGFEVADSAQRIALARRSLRSHDVLVVDTPPLRDPVDGRRIGALLRLLDALRPDETHLLLPAGADLTAARAFLGGLTRHLQPSRILITHADLRPHTGVPVGLSCSERIPVSFVGELDRPSGGLAPAEPERLARMVLA